MPADSLTVVVLANTNGPWAAASPTTSRAPRSASGSSAPPEKLADLPTTAAERARFAGTYPSRCRMGRCCYSAFPSATGKGRVAGEGQPEIPLRYQGNSVFGADFDPSLRLTFAPGTPTPKVTLVQSVATIDGPRVP